MLEQPCDVRRGRVITGQGAVTLGLVVVAGYRVVDPAVGASATRQPVATGPDMAIHVCDEAAVHARGGTRCNTRLETD
jgi:hypothetical protein